MTGAIDTELDDLPEGLRWAEWLARVEAVIFAATEPVSRQTIARIVGKTCIIDDLIDDLKRSLSSRPYALVEIAGGYTLRTLPRFGTVIRHALDLDGKDAGLSKTDTAILIAIAYFQPVTRAEISEIAAREISRDSMARLKAKKLIGNGPRAPLPGAPTTYVTTDAFLSLFGLNTLADLPEREEVRGMGHKIEAHKL